MTYLIEGTHDIIGLDCSPQICTCYKGIYTEPCVKGEDPCGCKSGFCGGQLCHPVQLTPDNIGA